MSTSRAVVSLATAEPRYASGLDRLSESLARVGFDGRALLWRPGSFPRGCPTHLEVPFAFKPYCLVEARQTGAELVLWLDSSCVAVRPLDGIFEAIERDGCLLFRNRQYTVGQWSSDEALARLGIGREEAMSIPEVNAAALGLDLRAGVGVAFLERWFEEARIGLAFRGVSAPLKTGADYEAVKWNRGGRVSADPRVRGHRHDQTVAGVLAHELGTRLTANGLEAVYGRPRSAGCRTAIVNVRRGRRLRRLARLLRHS